MPVVGGSFDSSKPVTVALSFRILAQDEATLERWQMTFSAAMDRMLELMHENFPGVEIVEDVELPPTEVKSRDEV